MDPLRSNFRNDTHMKTGANSGADAAEGEHAKHHNDLAKRLAVVNEAPFNMLLPDTGIVADGVSDDTTAINTVLAAAQPGHQYLFATPPGGGHYRISGTLDVPDVRGVAVLGESWHNSEIRQYGNNMPIIRSNGQYQRQRRFEDLKLSYQTEQATSNTLSTALELRSDDTLPSFFYSTLKRLHFYNVRRGIGINSPGQQFAVWNNDFDELLFENVSHSLIDIVPPVAAGLPVNNFKQIRALNNLSSYKTSVGVALRLFGEVQMSGLDVEDWYNIIMEAQSGNASVSGIHLERHTLNAAFGAMFYLANGSFTFDQVNLGDPTEVGGSGHWVFSLTNADLNVGTVELVSFAGSGSIAMIDASSTASRASVRTPRLGAGVTMPLAYPGVGEGEKVLTSLDGGAAPWNGYYALPTASAVYRGRKFFVQNGAGAGTGLADSLVVCVRDAGGTYSWAPLN